MRNLQCGSTQTSLFSCNPTYNAIGCNSNEVAGARCRGTSYYIIIYLCGRCLGAVTSSCVSGSVRLWRANNIGPTHDGLALYCKNSQWIPVCDDSYTCNTGRIFCQQLGYPGILSEHTIVMCTN